MADNAGDFDTRYAAEGLDAKRYADKYDLELKKIKYFEAGSEETSCFVADVYRKGKHVGTAQNDGHGGPTFVHVEGLDDMRLLERWADDQLELYLKAKDKARLEKWITKHSATFKSKGFNTAVVSHDGKVSLVATRKTTAEDFRKSSPKYAKCEDISIRI